MDPAKRSYDHYGMRRGATEVVNRKALVNSLRAISKGFRQTETRGDAFQNGGVIVVDSNGDIVYTHIEREAGDLADMDDVIAALG